MKTTTDSKKISATTWISIQAEDSAAAGHFLSGAAAALIMSAAHVAGTRTEEEWDALYLAAKDAEGTMKDAADFG
jgi:hypothetical protein